jgi:hypothetical protein
MIVPHATDRVVMMTVATQVRHMMLDVSSGKAKHAARRAKVPQAPSRKRSPRERREMAERSCLVAKHLAQKDCS